MVRPESNSRPPASQPDAQPTEPPVRGTVQVRSHSATRESDHESHIAVTLNKDEHVEPSQMPFQNPEKRHQMFYPFVQS